MLTFLGAYVDRVPLILRIGLGLTLIFSHGLPKLLEPERWAALGGAMANIGITFAPAFWGFMAGFTEFIGGVLLLIGLAVRPAAAINLFIMFIAAAQNLATVRVDLCNRGATRLRRGETGVAVVNMAAPTNILCQEQNEAEIDVGECVTLSCDVPVSPRAEPFDLMILGDPLAQVEECFEANNAALIYGVSCQNVVPR